jgi:hypothetical protein
VSHAALLFITRAVHTVDILLFPWGEGGGGGGGAAASSGDSTIFAVMETAENHFLTSCTMREKDGQAGDDLIHC